MIFSNEKTLLSIFPFYILNYKTFPLDDIALSCVIILLNIEISSWESLIGLS